VSREYSRLAKRRQAARRRGDRAGARELAQQMRNLPYGDPMDPGYRRLKYIRYADLCRRRHKSAYAEVRVMPIWLAETLVRAVSSFLVSA
jgi:hypothetical protein